VRFQVVFRPRAQADIAAAVAWRARKSPAAAAQWRSSLLRIVENLEPEPARYAKADEAADLGLMLRELHFGRRPNVYRVLFTVDGQTVNVLRVRHAAQERLRSRDI